MTSVLAQMDCLSSRLCLNQEFVNCNCFLCVSSLIFIGNEGIVDIMSKGLRGIRTSLKELDIRGCVIGNGGLSTLVEALQPCTGTGLKTLNLSSNDFSSAASGLSLLSDWLTRDEVHLERLNLGYCRINDEGLQVLAQGAANHCEDSILEEIIQSQLQGLVICPIQSDPIAAVWRLSIYNL